jgi:hypothetical protein
MSLLSNRDWGAVKVGKSVEVECMADGHSDLGVLL